MSDSDSTEKLVERILASIQAGEDPREAGESFVAIAYAWHRQTHHMGALKTCEHGGVPCLDHVEKMVRDAAVELGVVDAARKHLAETQATTNPWDVAKDP